MAISVLGVKYRGGNGTAQVIRQAGATASIIGRPFTILWGGLTGTIVAGDSITGDSSGATGVIKNVGVGLFGNVNVVVSVISGTFQAGETCTTTSGAISTGIGIGISNNNSAGIWPPEPDSGTVGWNGAQDRVLEFKGSLYCFLGPYIWKYDGTNDWSVVHSITNRADPTAYANLHGGLHVFYVSNQPFMGAVFSFGLTTLYRISSPDGVTWTEIAVDPSYYLASGGFIHSEVLLHNILYWTAYDFSVTTRTAYWNPSDDSIVATPGTTSPASDIIVFKDKLLRLEQLGNGNAGLKEFAGGTWNTVLDFSAEGAINGGGFTPVNTRWAMWAPGDGFLYALYAAYYNPSAGWVLKKIQYSGGTFSDVTPNTGPGRTIGPTVFAGTSIPLWTSGGGTNDPSQGRFTVVVDDATNPGTLTTYLYYASSDVIGTQLVTMQWNGDSSAVTLIGTGSDIANALANSRQGGGERIWTSGQPSIIITGASPIAGGVALSFQGFGGGTKSVKFVFGQTGEPPVTICTLANPSVGTLSNLNHQIDNVPMNGSTVTVNWLALSDGAVNLSNAQIEPVAF